MLRFATPPVRRDEDDLAVELGRLIEIGIALSAETDLDVLLDKIVRHAREVSRADAGTLYTVEDEALRFRIFQNDTAEREGRPGVDPSQLNPVPLDPSNVSAYVALNRSSVNVEDVYAPGEFDFSGPRRYDEKTGYRSRSMLVVPMKDREHTVIGVLQLINATDPETGDVTTFDDRVVPLVEALASQAAVAVSNAAMIENTKRLFESLVQVLGVALDAKSPHTGNHVQRVALLNTLLAQAIHEEREGPFADVSFTRDQMEELRLAGWLHDIGKVTTPSWLMDKATKLEGILDGIEVVERRFEGFGKTLELGALSEKLVLLRTGGEEGGFTEIDERLARDLDELARDLAFVQRCNRPDEALGEGDLERLEFVARKTCPGDGGGERYLTDGELHRLRVRRGTLTDEEFGVMRQHVEWTSRMLAKIPFDKRLGEVPTFAAQHHERINGTGYPSRLDGGALPLQSRILAVADIYEALSSPDRPYKTAMSPEQVFGILGRAADAGEIDGRIVDLMIRRRVHETFDKVYRESLRGLS